MEAAGLPCAEIPNTGSPVWVCSPLPTSATHEPLGGAEPESSRAPGGGRGQSQQLATLWVRVTLPELADYAGALGSQTPTALGSVEAPILGAKEPELRKVRAKVTQLGAVEWALNPDSPVLASSHHTRPPVSPPPCPQHRLRARPDAKSFMVPGQHRVQPSEHPQAASGIPPITELGNPRPKETDRPNCSGHTRRIWRPGSHWPVTEEPAGSLMASPSPWGGGQERVRAAPID